MRVLLWAERTGGVMMSRYVALSLALGMLFAGSAWGQDTRVQLPTWHQSGVRTTVMVPDRGSVYMGGIKRASGGRTTRGVPVLGKIPGAGRLFNNHGLSSSRGTSSYRVHATIIDLQEMDRRVLAQAAARRTRYATQPIRNQYADYLSRNVARRPHYAETRRSPTEVLRAVPSVADVRRQNALAAVQRDKEAVFFFAKGKAAVEANKPNVAKIYFKMAAKRAKGDFRRQVLAQLNAIEHPHGNRLASGTLR